MSYVPLKKADIRVGRPLPWPVFDANRKLLLKSGYVIENEKQLETLLEKGLYRSTRLKATEIRRDKPEVKTPEADKAAEPTVSFDDINLQIGETVQLQLADGTGERYMSRVIGYVKGKSVLVTNPVVEDKLIFVREGQSFIVRVFNGKSAFGFTSSILKTNTLPLPYLHLSFPTRIEGVAVRRSDRIDVKLIASVQSLKDDADKKSLPGTILNLSPTGALVQSKQPLGGIDEVVKITFRIKINMIDGYIETEAYIRSIRPIEDDAPGAPGYFNGMEFVELQQNDILLLHSLAYQKLIERIDPVAS